MFKHLHQLWNVGNIFDNWRVFGFTLHPVADLEPFVLDPLFGSVGDLLASSEATEAVVRSPVEHFVVLLVHQLFLQVVVELVVVLLELVLGEHFLGLHRSDPWASLTLLWSFFRKSYILRFNFFAINLFFNLLWWILIYLDKGWITRPHPLCLYWLLITFPG